MNAVSIFSARNLRVLAGALVLLTAACGPKEASVNDSEIPSTALSEAVLVGDSAKAGESALDRSGRLACDKVVSCASQEEQDQLGRDMLCVGVNIVRTRARINGDACETASVALLNCFSEQDCDALRTSPCSESEEAVKAACH